MKNLRVLAFHAFGVVLTLCLVTPLFAASPHRKPQLPLQISIAPAQPGVTPETIKAGDVVDFKVAATSMVDTSEMRIIVELIDGAERVSGDLSWIGPAGKKGKRELHFSVRVPATGIGKIKASLTIATDGSKQLSRTAEYLLLTGEQQRKQLEAQKMMKKNNPARKDSRGREVIEYR